MRIEFKILIVERFNNDAWEQINLISFKVIRITVLQIVQELDSLAINYESILFCNRSSKKEEKISGYFAKLFGKN